MNFSNRPSFPLCANPKLYQIFNLIAVQRAWIEEKIVCLSWYLCLAVDATEKSCHFSVGGTIFFVIAMKWNVNVLYRKKGDVKWKAIFDLTRYKNCPHWQSDMICVDGLEVGWSFRSPPSAAPLVARFPHGRTFYWFLIINHCQRLDLIYCQIADWFFIEMFV